MSPSNSLREALAGKGIQLPTRVPSCFQCRPKSLREIIRILQLPDVELAKWVREDIENFDEDWTNEFQGFANVHWFDYNVWIFSNASQLLMVSWVPRQSLEILRTFNFGELGPDFSQHRHFGNIDFSDGVLFVPVLAKDSTQNSRLLAFTIDLRLIGWAEFVGKKDSKNTGWCAVDPWNRDVLYCSDDSTHFFYAYDVSGFYDLLSKSEEWPKRLDITLLPRTIRLVSREGQPYTISGSLQGVAFSPQGRFYVSQARRTVGWDNHLLCFDALTGVCLGTIHVDHPDSTTVGEELQGPEYHDGGIYIPYLDNDGTGDEIDIVKMRHPDPTHPV